MQYNITTFSWCSNVSACSQGGKSLASSGTVYSRFT